MKVKVIKKFFDKHTKKLHKAGTILDIDEKRYEEIISVDAGLVEVVVAENATPVEDETPVEDKKPTEKKKTTKKATKKDTE